MMSLIGIPNCDTNNFQNIVFDFIERIAKEVAVFDCGNEFNLSESAFRHIELQIQAQRIEKVLQLCISKIRSVFVISQLVEDQRDHLKLFLEPSDVKRIENFAKKWFRELSESNQWTGVEFNIDLNQCLSTAEQTDIKFKMQLVILFNKKFQF